MTGQTTAHQLTLEEKIKAEAKALGFVLSGISQAESPPHFPNYLTWIERGFHAEMGYLARPDAIEARQDPTRLLPGCKTILSLAVPYPRPTTRSPETTDGPRGSIAAYALHPDYHEVLQERMRALAERMQALIGEPFSWKGCVDTSAILERDYAQHSGLGWIGRNACLVTREYGSWVFLCEMLLDLSLEPDGPVSSVDCVDCQRCLMSCPTKALQPRRTVDARLCLSYLTIEHRGPIPLELRPLMGTRVFGCDTCQAVCPNNRLSEQNMGESLFSATIDPNPNLREALAMSEVDFRAVYRNTPVWRCRYTGFIRNVAIASGNSGDASLLPALREALKWATDPVVRDSLEWAIVRLSA